MTFGSLFAGIGGMDLGLERSGMQCRWQIEIDPFCQKVLAKHWPDVRRHDDVKTFPPTAPEEWHVDLICGGFPCQDISYAGKGAGLEGARSGLWYEYARVIRVLRPRYVLVENVSALLVRGLDRVLGTLASIGYDAEWACIPASSVGAPHIRDRVFVYAARRDELADPECVRRTARIDRGLDPARPSSDLWTPDEASRWGRVSGQVGGDGSSEDDLSHSDHKRSPIGSCFGGDAQQELQAAQRGHCQGSGVWATEPDLGRVAHGVPDRVDRLRGLGNAVVPQVAQWVGERILESINRTERNDLS